MESKFGMRNKEHENHWQDCDLRDVRVTRPMIVCLSGSGATSQKDANGLCKMAEDGLADNASKVDLLGVSYGYDEEDAKKHGSGRGFLADKDREQFVDSILLPLCQNEQGELLAPDKCCKNLSLITFFTFCHGSTEVNKIMNIFNEKLLSGGISKEDVYGIDNSLFEICYEQEKIVFSCPKVELYSRNSSFKYWYLGEEHENDKLPHCTVVHDNPGQYCGQDFSYFPRDFEVIHAIADGILNERENNPFGGIVDEEHSIGHLQKDDEGNLNSNINEQGKQLRSVMDYSLNARVDNSFENLESEEYVPLDCKELSEDLKLLVTLNHTQTSKIEQAHDCQLEITQIVQSTQEEECGFEQ